MARRTRRELTPARAKRAIALTKVVAPLVAPYATAVAGRLRHSWDARRARQLGVPLTELNNHSGRGGALQARLTGMAKALAEFRDGQQTHATGAARQFAAQNEPRVMDLAAAVRAAQQMPSDRRRAAHRAVAAELDRMEDELLAYLGLRR